MPFRDRIIVTGSGKPPGKFYFHTSGRESFGWTDKQQVNGAADYLREVFGRSRDTLSPFYQNWGFMLGAIRGDEQTGSRVVDIFGFSKINVWPGNPDVHSVVVNEGAILRGSAISCSESLRVIGGELGIRAETSSLAGYFATNELPRTGLFEGRTHVVVL